MKTFRTLAAGSLAVGLAGFAAAAPVDIIVSGSTAYRSQVVAAEVTLASNGVTPGEAYVSSDAAFNASHFSGAAISVVHGMDASGNEIIFHNHWTGSTAGMTDLGNNNTTLTLISDAATPAIGVDAVVASADTSGAPEVAMCDCAFSDSARVLAGANAAGVTASSNITAAAPVQGGTLGEAYVGSVDFQWLLGVTSGGTLNTSLSNITQNNAEVLLSTGQIAANFINGNTADANSLVIFIGRNEDSGTRVLYQAEGWANGTGNSFGLGASTVQWLIEQTGVALPQNSSYSSLSAGTSIDKIQKWPQYNWNGSNYTTKSAGGWSLYTESTITWATLGHSGYNGGGDVAAILATPNPVSSASVSGVPTGFNQVYIVSCIGTHDAASAITAGAPQLSYDGVAYSKANIESGQYPLWNLEHLYYLTGTQSNSVNVVANGAVIKADADALADALYNGSFGTNSTDVGIAGHLVAGFPAMASRSAVAGSYLH